MKKKWFHTADNTILDCPNVDYKYNWDTYNREKLVFWVISIVGFFISLSAVICSHNGVVQTIAGAFLGGILSLIIWLFTIRQQDKMNYELALVDMHIFKIEEYIDRLNSKTKFIDPDEEELIDSDTPDVGKKFLLLLSIVSNICFDDSIDTTSIKLKLPTHEECNMVDYITRCEEMLINREILLWPNKQDLEKVVNWNFWYLDWQLNDLKDKLKRYRNYILCGNAPENYKNFQKIISKQNR